MRSPFFIDNDILPDELTSCHSEYVITTAISSDEITTDYDTFVSNLLSKEVSKYKDCDCIFLPYSLDRDHYSGMLGLVVAMHLRLTPEWGFSRKPIIFIGPDPIEQVAKLSEYGELLFTPWVFYSSLQTDNELNSLLSDIESRIGNCPEMSNEAYESFLKKMRVDPPAMFGTRHSIANSWCRYHWFKIIGIEDKIPENDKVLSNVLFFKYMKQVGQFKIHQESEEEYVFNPINNDSSKILLVDDEASKWAPFFKSILKESNNEHFISIGDNYNKDSKKDDLIQDVVEKVKTINPDVVLLDLRLHEDDSRNDIEKKDISGNIILRKIKDEINKGIQVIAFSASNKIWNYLPLSYDGIVLKESPEQSVQARFTQDRIDEMRKTIELCMLKGRWLTAVYGKIKTIKCLLAEDPYFTDKKDEVLNGIDVAFDILAQSDHKAEYRAYSYLQFFLTIEEYVKFASDDDIMKSIFYQTEDKRLYLNNGSDRYLIMRKSKNDQGYNTAISYQSGHYILGNGQYNNRFIDTNFLVSVLLIFKFRQNTSGGRNWTKVYTIRNTKAAHPKINDVSVSEINMLLDFMIFFFDNKNANWIDLRCALRDISQEEEINLLKEKFGSK